MKNVTMRDVVIMIGASVPAAMKEAVNITIGAGVRHIPLKKVFRVITSP